MRTHHKPPPCLGSVLPLSRPREPLPGAQEVPRQDQGEEAEVETDGPVEGVHIRVGGGREREEGEGEHYRRRDGLETARTLTDIDAGW